MKLLLLFATPILLLLIVTVSFVVCIYLFAKAHGNIKAMSGGRKTVFIISALVPLVLIVLAFTSMSLFSSNARNELANDIQSGAITVYRVDDTKTSRTQTVALGGNSGAPYLLFDIFADNLYTEESGADIKIRTREFEGVSQIKRDSVGFVRFLRHGGSLSDANGQESILKKERTKYTRLETALGTVFEVEEKYPNPNSGRFLYRIYFAASDYSMLISVSYNSEEDLSVRSYPVVSREYAQKLYNLITSTVKVDPTKLHAVYNLQAI